MKNIYIFSLLSLVSIESLKAEKVDYSKPAYHKKYNDKEWQDKKDPDGALIRHANESLDKIAAAMVGKEESTHIDAAWGYGSGTHKFGKRDTEDLKAISKILENQYKSINVQEGKNKEALEEIKNGGLERALVRAAKKQYDEAKQKGEVKDDFFRYMIKTHKWSRNSVNNPKMSEAIQEVTNEEFGRYSSSELAEKGKK